MSKMDPQVYGSVDMASTVGIWYVSFQGVQSRL